VKGRILERLITESSKALDFHRPTLKEFLVAFVTFRFQLYAQRPELVRLMGWQRLESQKKSLEGVNIKNMTDIQQEIVFLQAAGEIRKDLKPEVISYLIMSMASNGFMDKAPFLNSKKDQEQYLKVIIDGLIRILSPEL
jgi:hypothetical protein